MKLDPHRMWLDPAEQENNVVTCPASPGAVLTVLSADEDAPDGRSQFCWVRLGNGDLILGVYPQGDTYFATEKYHSAPASQGGDCPDSI